MGDFRIGSVSPVDKYRDQETPDPSKRKKPKPREGHAPEPTEDYFEETRDSTLCPPVDRVYCRRFSFPVAPRAHFHPQGQRPAPWRRLSPVSKRPVRMSEKSLPTKGQRYARPRSSPRIAGRCDRGQVRDPQMDRQRRHGFGWSIDLPLAEFESYPRFSLNKHHAFTPRPLSAALRSLACGSWGCPG
jgi:hypothetical protein